MTVALALSYGGRQDIAARRRADRARRSRRDGSRPIKSTSTRSPARLTTAGLPDPDLLIRTSGELRISNFFLFQLAYTELYFTETLWPDFREREFLSALAAYQARERRFGTVESGPNHRLRAAN